MEQFKEDFTGYLAIVATVAVFWFIIFASAIHLGE